MAIRHMSRIIVHLIAEDTYPSPGGLQLSVARIRRLISQLDNTSADICALSTNCLVAHDPGDGNPTLTSLFADVQAVADPLYNAVDGRFLGAFETVSSRKEWFRLAYLQILRYVQQQLSREPDAQHILLSFYVTDIGFIVQQVALREKLRHIVAIRGSDYSRGFFCPDTIGAVEYVLRRADYVIVTNDEQRKAIKYFFGIHDKITVIYNSVARYPALWKPKPRPYVQLFSDSGYAYKKGTHILLRAFEQLRKEGLDLKLCVIGSTLGPESAYWERIRKEVKETFPEDVKCSGIERSRR